MTLRVLCLLFYCFRQRIHYLAASKRSLGLVTRIQFWYTRITKDLGHKTWRHEAILPSSVFCCSSTATIICVNWDSITHTQLLLCFYCRNLSFWLYILVSRPRRQVFNFSFLCFMYNIYIKQSSDNSSSKMIFILDDEAIGAVLFHNKPQRPAFGH